MSAFADVRNDDIYNERFLSERDSLLLKGYDYALNKVSELFVHNLDVFRDEFLNVLEDGEQAGDDEVFPTSPLLYQMCRENTEFLNAVVMQWCEMERNGLVVSMLDSEVNSKDRDYLKRRSNVLASDPDGLYDTLYYAMRGVKRVRSIEGS